MSLRKRRPYQECAYFWGAMHKKRMKKPGWELFMRLCGRRSGSAALRHAVADAHLCEEIPGSAGFFFDLPADVGHVYPENLVVAAGPGPHSSLMMKSYVRTLPAYLPSRATMRNSLRVRWTFSPRTRTWCLL